MNKCLEELSLEELKIAYYMQEFYHLIRKNEKLRNKIQRYNMNILLVGKNSTLEYEKDYLSEERSEILFNRCKELKLIKNPKIKIYGKEATMHRSVGFFSDESEGYRYSGQLAKSQPLPNFLKRLLVRVNTKYDTNFNGILINRYEDSSDYIGPHSDDEKALGGGKIVVGISLGAERIMRFRNKSDKKIVYDMKMSDGCIFAMRGEFQSEYTHEVPKISKDIGLRISLTFRRHLI